MSRLLGANRRQFRNGRSGIWGALHGGLIKRSLVMPGPNVPILAEQPNHGPKSSHCRDSAPGQDSHQRLRQGDTEKGCHEKQIAGIENDGPGNLPDHQRRSKKHGNHCGACCAQSGSGAAQPPRPPANGQQAQQAKYETAPCRLPVRPESRPQGRRVERRETAQIAKEKSARKFPPRPCIEVCMPGTTQDGPEYRSTIDEPPGQHGARGPESPERFLPPHGNCFAGMEEQKYNQGEHRPQYGPFFGKQRQSPGQRSCCPPPPRSSEYPTRHGQDAEDDTEAIG